MEDSMVSVLAVTLECLWNCVLIGIFKGNMEI